MQYMGGKSRIARPIAEIINTALNGGIAQMRYQGGKSRIATPLAQILNTAGGLALLAFSVVVVPLKAKLPAMIALF